MSAPKGSLGEILKASQIITAEDVQAALEEQKRSGVRFGEALINLGVVTQEDIDWALSNQLDLPYIRLKKDMIDRDAVSLLPAVVARKFNCIPLIKAGGEISVAIADPLNKIAIEQIESVTGCSVNISVALIREIREMITAFYGEAEDERFGFESKLFSQKALEAINADIKGGKLLDYLMIFMIQNRVSHLFVQPTGDYVSIKGKRNNLINYIGKLEPNHFPEFLQKLKKRAEVVADSAVTTVGIFPVEFHGNKYYFQISAIQAEGGECITVEKYINYSNPENIDELNLDPIQKNIFSSIASATSGITFVSSKYLQNAASLIDIILEISTAYNKNCILIGKSAGRKGGAYPRIIPGDPKAALDIISRIADQKPDIVVIEDAADPAIFAALFRLAMKGVKIIASVEAGNLLSVIDKINLFKRGDSALYSLISGIISISNLNLLCPSCKIEDRPLPEDLALIKPSSMPGSFYKSTGCEECSNTGIIENKTIYELLKIDKKLAQDLQLSDFEDDIRAILAKAGFISKEKRAVDMLRDGKISAEEYVNSIML